MSKGGEATGVGGEGGREGRLSPIEEVSRGRKKLREDGWKEGSLPCISL